MGTLRTEEGDLTPGVRHHPMTIEYVRVLSTNSLYSLKALDQNVNFEL